jgi:hypothetical protein
VSGEIRTRRRPAVSDDDKLRRRDQIMAAAKKVFASNGFHSTTINGFHSTTIAATGQRSDRSWAPLRAAVQATFEFFEKDKATAKLLLRDAYAQGERFETHLNNIYESFIDDIDQYMTVGSAAK